MTTSPAPRQTRQRSAVKALLDDLEEFRSAQQVHELLRSRGASVGLTTVYRCLQALADSGEVDSRVNDEGETVYRKCSDHHHHHLVCRECGTHGGDRRSDRRGLGGSRRRRERLHIGQSHIRDRGRVRRVQCRTDGRHARLVAGGT